MSNKENRIKVIEAVTKYMNKHRCTKKEAIDSISILFPELSLATIERYTRQIDIEIKKSIDMDKNKRIDTHYKSKYFELLRKETNIQTLKDAICSEITPIKFFKTPSIVYSNTTEKSAYANLMLSDLHAGRHVNEIEIEYMNKFDFEVGCTRLYNIYIDFIKYIQLNRNQFSIDKLFLDLLGDFINDESRMENKHTNEWPNPITLVNTSKVMSQLILLFIPHFKQIEISGVIGNESRIPEMMPGKMQYHNYDFLLYNMVQAYLIEFIHKGVVKFNIPLSPELIVDKGAHKVLLTHGHNIGGSNVGGFPVNRLSKYVKEQQEMRKASGGFDFIEIGHFHSSFEIEDEKLLVNGSICGIDEWAKTTIRKRGRVSQTAYILSDDYGIESKRLIKNVDGQNKHPFEYDYKF